MYATRHARLQHLLHAGRSRRDPTILESFVRAVDWPLLPREGEGLDLGEGGAVTVESVGYDIDGYPNAFLGRLVLDDLRAAQLRKLGWRASPLPFSRR